MFESLTRKFSSVFDKLRGYGKLSEANITEALREVKLALLEADVNLLVVKTFLEKVKERALGETVVKSLNPDAVFLQIVHEELVAVLGGGSASLDLSGKPPFIILMVGLQGAGKTTTTAKLANYYKKKGRVPYLVPADVNRPAAIEQLQTLAGQLAIPCHPTLVSDKPANLVLPVVEASRSRLSDIIFFDTAGRLAIDTPLMDELSSLKNALLKQNFPADSIKIILVVDSMLGQEAVKTAKTFDEKVGISGLILTKLDGEAMHGGARGGAAFSIHHELGKPVYFIGTGEKTEDLELFDPKRLVDRLLDRGDILSLAQKAQEVMTEGSAREMGQKLFRKDFNLEDFKEQLLQMKKMGSMKSLMGFIPGGKALSNKVDFDSVEKDFKKKEAIINSMTPIERRRPDVLNGSRRLRVALGSGTQVSEVNRLLKEFDEMRKMMKSFKGKGMKSLMSMRGMLGM